MKMKRSDLYRTPRISIHSWPINVHVLSVCELFPRFFLATSSSTAVHSIQERGQFTSSLSPPHWLSALWDQGFLCYFLLGTWTMPSTLFQIFSTFPLNEWMCFWEYCLSHTTLPLDDTTSDWPVCSSCHVLINRPFGKCSLKERH